MTDVYKLRSTYRDQINRTFNLQDVFTVAKAIRRSRKIQPRGKAYRRIITKASGSVKQQQKD